MALRKMLTSVASPCSINLFHTCIRVCDVGGRGSGAGRGGGGGGSIRESGGKLGEMAAAKEDEYFYKKVRPATVIADPGRDLFNCSAHPTQLDPTSLWINPDAAATFLDLEDE
ncbi:uncharacterized protein LOC103509536 [Diaphorina citri]|uniref:Uncharacterized protein LOC103509536 n=1 Tax=Diaphorina citri TaxID=121845 RepID=A0A1S3D321_DIACI|nr:uncharacterized protein LOC103509536 [Diaphorina citri]